MTHGSGMGSGACSATYSLLLTYPQYEAHTPSKGCCKVMCSPFDAGWFYVAFFGYTAEAGSLPQSIVVSSGPSFISQCRYYPPTGFPIQAFAGSKLKHGKPPESERVNGSGIRVHRCVSHHSENTSFCLHAGSRDPKDRRMMIASARVTKP